MDLIPTYNPKVSAVVLSTGAPTFQEALGRIQVQTVKLANIIIVDETISPFHKALNHGAGWD